MNRYYVDPDFQELRHDFWLHDKALLKRITENLNEGDELVLFDGVSEDRLYKLSEVESDGLHLEMVTELDRNLPKKHVYLFWVLGTDEVNAEILKKCTVLGVSNFIPLVSEKKGKAIFDIEKTNDIVIEAAETGKWSLIPHLREPLTPEEAIKEYKNRVTLFIYGEAATDIEISSPKEDEVSGIFVGSQNGWSENELQMFKKAGIKNLPAAEFLNVAEAALDACTKLLQ